MRCANVYYQDQLAGQLWEDQQRHFHYQYTDAFVRSDLPPLSPNLPKQVAAFTAPNLFPLFFNMLPEGSLRQLQLRAFKVDEQDYFGLLLATAQHDTIGAVTVKTCATDE